MRNRVWELYMYTCCISLPMRSRQPRSGAEFFQRAVYVSVFPLQQVSPRLNFYTGTSLKKLSTQTRGSARPEAFRTERGFDGNRTVDVSARYVSLDIFLVCRGNDVTAVRGCMKKKTSYLFRHVLCKSDEMRVDPADPLKLKKTKKKTRQTQPSGWAAPSRRMINPAALGHRFCPFPCLIRPARPLFVAFKAKIFTFVTGAAAICPLFFSLGVGVLLHFCQWPCRPPDVARRKKQCRKSVWFWRFCTVMRSRNTGRHERDICCEIKFKNGLCTCTHTHWYSHKMRTQSYTGFQVVLVSAPSGRQKGGPLHSPAVKQSQSPVGEH